MHEFTLSNGMHFLVTPRKYAPVVSCHTYADVGAFDEQDGQTGEGGRGEGVPVGGGQAGEGGVGRVCRWAVGRDNPRSGRENTSLQNTRCAVKHPAPRRHRPLFGAPGLQGLPAPGDKELRPGGAAAGGSRRG